jgi:cyclic-di-GMP-binding protein
MKNATPLKLKLPERTTAPADSFLLDIKKVEAWVSSLPIANTGESSKRVFQTLVELNRIDLVNLKRVKIVNTLQPVVKYITSNLRKYYLDSSLPLAAKNQKVVVLCRELYSELANSHKIIVEKMAIGEGEKLERKLMVIALHQAIYYLSKVLYFSVIVYNPYPVDIWREIHQLFMFAEQNDLSRIKINGGARGNGHISTIEEIYKSALLLALASPYRLRQQEIEHLYQKLPEWAGYIQVRTPQPDTGSEYESHFFVRTETDEPPMHISLQTMDMSNQCRLIDTLQLVQHLRKELKTIYSKKGESALFTREMLVNAPMLRKVIKSLTDTPKRGFIRTRLNFELDTAVGINEIHSQISAYMIKNQGSNLEEQETTIGDEEKEGLKDSSFLDSFFTADNESLQIVPLDHPVDEAVLNPKDIQDTWIVDDGAPAWASQQQDNDIDTFSCKTFNESAGGYCINWAGSNPPKIRVGELIGIQSASDRSQFSIGIARWLRHMPGVGLQLGMEIISPTAEAIKIHIPGDDQHSQTTQKCILLPEVAASNRPPCLILPVLNIRVGDKIRIESGDQQQPAKLIRLLESTGTFSQFEFAYLDQAD